MEINKQNGSIIINESDIKNMIKESINRMIKYYMDSGIFSDYPLLSKLEKLLYLFL
jgi:ABC-type transport system involved in Fe-S cluster assembly fused permease/ATPase subunit